MVVLVLLAACSAPVRLQVIRTNLIPTGSQVGEPNGACDATLDVRVVDASGGPVPGAVVVAHEGEAMSAPSMMPNKLAYATAEVVTNTKGWATVCKPESLRQFPKDMFTHSTGAYVEAKFGPLAGRVLPPYREPIVVRMPSSPDVPE